MSARKADIVIVGAGFAGLGAADAIAQYNLLASKTGGQPLSYVLLEGADRAGGRTSTVVTDPQYGEVGYIDVGGEYLGTTQSYMADLVDRLNVSTFETSFPDDKESIFQAPGDGQLTYFLGNYPITLNIYKTIQTIEALTQTTKASLAEPWNALMAPALDSITVKDWSVAALGNDAYGQELMELAIRCAFSVEWDQMSMLFLLFYGATCGSFEAFENVTGAEGGDRIRFTYGTQSLVKAMLESFKADARYLGFHTGQRVEKIQQNPGGATIVTVNGGADTWEAGQVIVAMSPRPSLKINYDPDLPAARRGLAEGMRMGHTIKGFLLYDKPWWRNNYTGYVLSAKGPACWVMDNTWQDPDTKAFKHPALMTFIAGAFADAAPKTKEGRRDALAAQMADIFQDPRALKPTGYIESDWQSDPFAGGCPAAVPQVGAIMKYRSAIRDKFGTIHWAGSEAGLEWTGGYMNGAVQSGVRAAGEAINALLFPALYP
jgi:monoamine oxidase